MPIFDFEGEIIIITYCFIIKIDHNSQYTRTEVNAGFTQVHNRSQMSLFTLFFSHAYANVAEWCVTRSVSLYEVCI